MRIQTLSILAGSEACNARCPFCVSKMTPPLGVELKEPDVNWRNFRKACALATQSGVTTAMLTSKGEPTLFPKQITRFLDEMAEFKFPLIELQTNGIPIAERPDAYAEHLKHWYERGMTTIAVSVVHFDPEKNREIYLPYKKSYIDLPKLIATLHEQGFSVRLTTVLVRGFLDTPEKVAAHIAFAKSLGVEQLTLTPVNKPEETENLEVWKWTSEHHLTDDQVQEIVAYVETHGTRLMHLAHGAVVYDVSGQNVCLNNCLKVNPESEEIRNLIFFPDGHLRYYWQYPGAIII